MKKMKMSLNKETLRALTPNQLNGVGGGLLSFDNATARCREN